MVALLKLLKSLCPGALRPCDALVSALLSSAVDLNSLSEMHAWVAFTIASLVIIFQLSPEEAILGRLQVRICLVYTLIRLYMLYIQGVLQ